MSGATESLSRKIDGARDLGSVVRSMKALAASSIGQYERAAESLRDYQRTVEVALAVCLREFSEPKEPAPRRRLPAGVVLMGSDQGLVGRFNEILMEFVTATIGERHLDIGRVWAVGARIEQLIDSSGLPAPLTIKVPYSVEAITPLVGELLSSIQQARDSGSVDAIYVFHNQPGGDGVFHPVCARVLPLDARWRAGMTAVSWPTKMRPQVVDGSPSVFPSLIQSYLFVLLFQASAESLASENASRLAAMQRAEENIAAMLIDLTGQFHRMRQTSIDEELFEVVSGYEALT